MFMTFEQKLKDEAFIARQKGLEEGEKTVLRMLVDRGMISEEQAAKVLKEVATGEGNE